MLTKKPSLGERAYKPARKRGVAHPWWRSVFLVALAVSLLLASTFGAENAHACSCVRLSQEEQLQRSDAVFSGEVVAVEEDAEEEDTSSGPPLGGPITFEVEKSWKGVSEERAVVYAYGQDVSCGIEAREGERYLVYANRGGQGEDAPLRTGTCSGTKPLGAAGSDLAALGPAEIPTSETNTPEETTEGGSGRSSGSDGGNEARELPRTGGVGAVLLALGAGAMFVGSRVLIRRMVR